jgi:predicted amidophosphoribosyltransferase
MAWSCNGFWTGLTRCLSCEARAEPGAFPYCALCLEGLIAAPAPCTGCGRLDCGRGFCLGARGPVRSWHARWLAVGTGHAALRGWKTHQGPAADRRILVPDAELLQRLTRLEIDGVTPVPQSVLRSRQLGGSPALAVARWLAASLGIPLYPDLLTIAPDAHRQAERGLRDRLLSPRRFQPARPAAAQASGRRLLLTDDILTTGRTLRESAEALLEAGATEVHAFALGYRPRRIVEARGARPCSLEAESA